MTPGKKLALWMLTVNLATFLLPEDPPRRTGFWIIVNLIAGAAFLIYEHLKFRRDFDLYFKSWKASQHGAVIAILELGRKVGKERIREDEMTDDLRRMPENSERRRVAQKLLEQQRAKVRGLLGDWEYAKRLFARRFPKSTQTAPHWSLQQPYKGWKESRQRQRLG